MRRWVSHELLCETQPCEEETGFYTVDKHRSSTVSNKNLHFKQSHDILERRSTDAAQLYWAPSVVWMNVAAFMFG